MARWRLTEPHYLKVEDTFWEQVETDRDTGRQKRKQYPVPLYLNPNSPLDWNYKPNQGQGHVSTGGNSFDEGAIVVCWKDKGERRDIVFFGPPTPGMEPIDDEAKEISAGYDWSHPIDDLSPTFSEAKLSEAAGLFGQAAADAMRGQHNADLLAMQKQMMDMMNQMTQAMTMIAGALNQVQNPTRRA